MPREGDIKQGYHSWVYRKNAGNTSPPPNAGNRGQGLTSGQKEDGWGRRQDWNPVSGLMVGSKSEN